VSARLLNLLDQIEPALVRQVFTHSSWVAERSRSYERLEFLGDSVLSLSITTELYRRYPQFSEGHLARLRAYIVSRETCAKVAQDLGLSKLLRRYGVENHENGELDQLAANANVLADLTEALIGAIYLTYGLDTVRPAVIEVFTEHIRFAEKSYVDYKTELQELLARSARSVSYRLVAEIGPAHDRRFEVEAVVDGETLGRGAGPSKKRAEQQAAAEALAALQERTDRAARPRMRLFGRRRSPEDET
jgi:ribonuclease III